MYRPGRRAPGNAHAQNGISVEPRTREEKVISHRQRAKRSRMMGDDGEMVETRTREEIHFDAHPEEDTRGFCVYVEARINGLDMPLEEYTRLLTQLDKVIPMARALRPPILLGAPRYYIGYAAAGSMVVIVWESEEGTTPLNDEQSTRLYLLLTKFTSRGDKAFAFGEGNGPSYLRGKMFKTALSEEFHRVCHTTAEVSRDQVELGLHGWGLNPNQWGNLVTHWGPVIDSKDFREFFQKGIPIKHNYLQLYIDRTTGDGSAISYYKNLEESAPEFTPGEPYHVRDPLRVPSPVRDPRPGDCIRTTTVYGRSGHDLREPDISAIQSRDQLRTMSSDAARRKDLLQIEMDRAALNAEKIDMQMRSLAIREEIEELKARQQANEMNATQFGQAHTAYPACSGYTEYPACSGYPGYIAYPVYSMYPVDTGADADADAGAGASASASASASARTGYPEYSLGSAIPNQVYYYDSQPTYMPITDSNGALQYSCLQSVPAETDEWETQCVYEDQQAELVGHATYSNPNWVDI